ncbi:MAG: DNA polymerase III subunit beta [Candidatus Pacebacteria bacterium CG10_big_fil_rev_8_21_14_0_10_44_11]|nr:MAG: DNA polymerase III subunit beta [Candidatus Pacebacteria bacterium CG10_big_fil_rev_8_21_14_0_10_44_11]
MKQIVLQENFQQALNYLQKAIPTRPSLPILSSVLLEVTKKSCTIAATDLYFGVRAQVPTKVEAEGNLTVPGKQLKEIIQSFPAGSVTIEQKDTQLDIISAVGKASLPIQTSQEYPPFPKVEGEKFVLPRSVIDDIKKYVIKSTSLDPTRPVLTGVYLEFSPEGLTVAGTDGFRLSVLSIPLKTKQITSLIIPAKVLEEVQRIAELLQVQELSFSVSEELKQVFFSFDEVEVFARLIDGEYPPFRQIIPESFTTQITVSTAEFQDQLKRGLIFSRESSIVLLHFSETELKVSALSSTAGNYEGVVGHSKITGEVGSIAFNAKYVLDYLQTIQSESLTMSLKGSQKAAVFKSQDELNYLHLIMPFRINQ